MPELPADIWIKIADYRGPRGWGLLVRAVPGISRHSLYRAIDDKKKATPPKIKIYEAGHEKTVYSTLAGKLHYAGGYAYSRSGERFVIKIIAKYGVPVLWGSMPSIHLALDKSHKYDLWMADGRFGGKKGASVWLYRSYWREGSPYHGFGSMQILLYYGGAGGEIVRIEAWGSGRRWGALCGGRIMEIRDGRATIAGVALEKSMAEYAAPLDGLSDRVIKVCGRPDVLTEELLDVLDGAVETVIDIVREACDDAPLEEE